MDLVTVAEILGHSDLKMVMRYAHPTPENKRKAVSVLASVMRGRGEIREMDQEKGHEKSIANYKFYPL